VAYRMTPLPMPLNDLEGQLFETILTPIPCETSHEFTNSTLRGPSAVVELVSHLSSV